MLRSRQIKSITSHLNNKLSDNDTKDSKERRRTFGCLPPCKTKGTLIFLIITTTIIMGMFLSILQSKIVRLFSKDNEKFINYTLLSSEASDFKPFNNTYDIFYNCRNDAKYRRETSPTFLSPSVLNFVTMIRTNLNIVFVGDSVGIQLSQALQEAVSVPQSRRKVLHYSWRDHEGVHFGATPEGGSVAGFRITGLFTEKQKDNLFQLPPTPGGGWKTEHIQLLNDALNYGTIGEDEYVRKHQKYWDVGVIQWPYGWLRFKKEETRPPELQIDSDAIREAIDTTFHEFGVETVVLLTIPIQNNVFDIKNEILFVRRSMYDFVEAYMHEPDRKVKNVVVMDISFLTMSLFLHNSIHLGILPKDNDASNMSSDNSDVTFQEYTTQINNLADVVNPLMNKRMDCCHVDYKQIIGYSCGERADSSTKKCKRNFYSHDGMHFCMHMVGGRMHAAFACLLRCVYEKNYRKHSNQNFLKNCELKCNTKFMTFRPIQWEGLAALDNY
jgi:hypothetical protein